MPSVLSKPLYFWSKYNDLQNEIHTDKQCVMNCHWWIKYGSVIIDPTPQTPEYAKVPEFAFTGERLYFSFLTKTIQKYDGTSCGGRQKGMKNIWMN